MSHDRTKSFQASIPALLEDMTREYGSVRIDRTLVSTDAGPSNWFVASCMGHSGSGDSIGLAVRALHLRLNSMELPVQANPDPGPSRFGRYGLALGLVELIVLVFAGLVFIVADAIVTPFQAVIVAAIIAVAGTAVNLACYRRAS